MIIMIILLTKFLFIIILRISVLSTIRVLIRIFIQHQIGSKAVSQLHHSQQWWANHSISIEGLKDIVPKWNNRSSKVGHLVFPISQWCIMVVYQIHWALYKFAIKSVSLFKYFKRSSLFCNDCHSLHFTFVEFHSGSGEGTSWWLQWTLSVEFSFTQYKCSYVATCYYVVASLVWSNPIFMHAGAFISLTVQAPYTGRWKKYLTYVHWAKVGAYHVITGICCFSVHMRRVPSCHISTLPKALLH